MYSIKAVMISAIAVCVLILGGMSYSDRRAQSSYAKWAQEQNRILMESQRAAEAENVKRARPEKPKKKDTKADETSTAAAENDVKETSAVQSLKYTTSAGVNVRRSASQTGEKIGTLEKGTVLEEAQAEGDWIRFRYRGGNGYVSAQYVSAEEE